MFFSLAHRLYRLIFQGSSSQWRIVFFIASGIYFIGNTLFVIFGKTEIQPWNESQKSQKELEAQQQSRPSDFGTFSLRVN